VLWLDAGIKQIRGTAKSIYVVKRAASIRGWHAGSVTNRSKMLRRGKNNRINTNKKTAKQRGWDKLMVVKKRRQRTQCF
jgi:hypothetical protein